MDINSIYAIQENKMYNNDNSVSDYHDRHGVKSILILKNFNKDHAQKYIMGIMKHIKNKIVVEIGAGVGYLAIEMAKHAKKVIAIEADPAWTWYYTEYLYKEKPANLTWIFGAAQEVAQYIQADVAIVCSNSGINSMKKIASKMARKVIII